MNNKNIYDFIGFPTEQEIVSPYIDYYLEDKSKYPKLNTCLINDKDYWKDDDNDFLLGESGGVLMNMDFVFINTKVFCEVADGFMQSGNTDETRFYFDAPYLSEDYCKFWDRETLRRRHGMTAKCKLYTKDIHNYLTAVTDKDASKYLHDVHITGDHYTYLNYGRIERTPTKEERAYLDSKGLFKQTTIPGFPRFWDGDYWNFKLDNLIANNNKNLCKAKARRKGFSYKRGNQAANTINMYKGTTVTLAAYDAKYLTDRGATSYMAKMSLDWFETHTDWVRGYISESLEDIILGYKESSEGHRHKGWNSSLYSVGCGRNESAAIGKKAVELDFEEAGKFANIQATLDVTMSNIEAGNANIGTIRVYGTAGTKEANWAGFKEIFLNPDMYNMLALENIYDKNSRATVCGFFFPQILCYEPFIDEHGNSQLISAYYADLKRKEVYRAKLTGNRLVIAIGQRANSPSEAFNISATNIFSSYELDDHVMKLINEDEYKFYKDGQLTSTKNGIEFIANINLPKEHVHPFITSINYVKGTDPYGCWREYYAPFLNDKNELDSNQYCVVYDPYGINKSIESLELYHSYASIQVWSSPFCKAPYGGDRLVAEFVGRRDNKEALDTIFKYACIRWKSKGLVEINKGDTVTNFYKWKCTHLLLKDPTALLEKGEESKVTEYGVSIKNDLDKLDYIQDCYDFLYTPKSATEEGYTVYRLSYILSVMLFKELQVFNHKGNFDRISTLILYMIYRKVLIRQEKKHNKKDINKENRVNIFKLRHGINI